MKDVCKGLANGVSSDKNDEFRSTSITAVKLILIDLARAAFPAKQSLLVCVIPQGLDIFDAYLTPLYFD